MKLLPAVSLAVGAVVLSNAAYAGNASSPAEAAWVTRYQPEEGFYHVVADKRFVGYYVAKANACSLNILIGAADERDLSTKPLRMTFDLHGSQSIALAADKRQSLGFACAPNAQALTITTERLPENTAALRD